MTRPTKPMLAAAALGVALAVAPAALQMFSRAPRGGEMITAFAPYMSGTTIDRFAADLNVIDAAHAEASRLVSDPASRSRYAATAAFDEQWSGIDADMSSMLATMRSDLSAYRAVAALPPFALFPYFFLLPGLAIAAAALLLSGSRQRQRVVIAGLGLSLIAAPVVFQMFTRAPAGQSMIAGFSSFMTREKVVQIQGYFLTIGAAEGELRLQLAPTAPDAEVAAIHALNTQWPRIAATMAPMIGAMSDNVTAFQGIAALPPFGWFPWFFVVPGVGLVLLAAIPAQRGVSS